MNNHQQTPYQVAHRMVYFSEWKEFEELYKRVDIYTTCSTNTIRQIDFWLDVRLELKKLEDVYI